MKKFLQKISLIAAPFLIICGISFAVATPLSVSAAPKDAVKNGFIKAGGTNADTNTGSGGTFRTTLQNIINILLFIIGIIAVIVIVIAGIQYATSGGNADQASKAKNAIIYAVVGIIVAVMAYAIVGFVIGNI